MPNCPHWPGALMAGIEYPSFLPQLTHPAFSPAASRAPVWHWLQHFEAIWKVRLLPNLYDTPRPLFSSSCCASMQILFPSLANDQFSCLILLDTWKFGCKILWLGNCLASDDHYHHHEIMMIFMSDDDNGRVVLVATDWHGPECLFSDVPQRNCNGLVLPSSSSSKM